MIDSILARYNNLREKPLDPNYSPDKAIRGKLNLNLDGSNKLAVIFPGWHTHNFPVNNLAKRLAKNGWGVIVYDFHDQILEPNDEVVVESFKYIRDEISKELDNLLAKNDYSKVHFIGISLGNVPMTLVADKFPHFQSASLVVGGDYLAIDMWYGLRTQGIRRQFEKLHVGVRRLNEEWQSISPINHIRHFANKEVLVYMALNDKYVGTKYQRKLAERIAAICSNLTVKKNYGGHAAVVLKFCLLEKLPKD